jgi:phage head maturation protease
MNYHNPPGLKPGQTFTRFADVAPSSYSKKDRTVECVISVGSPVERFYGTERLRITDDAVDLSRLSDAGIPLLDSHNQHGIDNALGRFTRIWIGRSKGKPALLGTITFNDTERGRTAEGMVARGEIVGISAGYTVQQWEIRDSAGTVLDPEHDRIPMDGSVTFTATRWTLLEGSLCSVAADQSATVRSFDLGSSISDVRARMQARQRMADANKPIKRTPSGDTSKESTNMNFHVTRDERDGVADAMQIALTSRLLASRGRSLTVEYQGADQQEKNWISRHRSQAQQYMGMGLVEMAAECIGYRGRGNYLRAGDALQIFARAFNSQSDFPNIFQNALNKALLARYVLATPTYREIAAERTFNDFRPHPQVRAGDFPKLKPVLETGELQYASTTDSGESISVSPYGIVFSISRQMLVNDDLGAIDQILGSAGDMVLVFENTTFFAMFNSNPTLLQDSTAVFASGHGNLVGTGSGAAPSVATIGAGRQALRGMKSISGNFINVPASIILTGPQQETAADQMVTAITPMLTTSVNPFSGRRRSVSDANIADASWYLACDPAKVPNFVYGFLAGSGGPRTRTYEPFGTQGVKVSLEHDFGCGAIDYRGMYKNAGS